MLALTEEITSDKRTLIQNRKNIQKPRIQLHGYLAYVEIRAKMKPCLLDVHERIQRI